MRWFKHDSSLRNDIRVKLLRKKFGAEGYSAFLQLVELIAESADRTNIDSWGYLNPLYSDEEISSEIGLKLQKFIKIKEFLIELSLISIKNSKIYYHDILNMLDEYAEKIRTSRLKNTSLSGQSRDFVGAEEEERKREKLKNNFSKTNGYQNINNVKEEKTEVASEYADDIFKDDSWEGFKQ